MAMRTDRTARHDTTWDEMQAWETEERWELIDGDAYCMSPAPTSRHQAIVTDLSAALGRHLRGGPCRSFVAPEVKLSAVDVVQPDVLVICDPSQIRESHIEGAPTLVVEVISPASERHDRVRKLRLYARYGVREYWLVQPYPAVVEVLGLTEEATGESGFRIAGVYTELDELRSPAFPDLRLDLSEVFTLPVPDHRRIDEIRESAPPYGAGATSAESDL